MKQQVKTKDGVKTITLTQSQIETQAAAGNYAAKKELYKQAKKDTLEERVKALEDWV